MNLYYLCRHISFSVSDPKNPKKRDQVYLRDPLDVYLMILLHFYMIICGFSPSKCQFRPKEAIVGGIRRCTGLGFNFFAFFAFSILLLWLNSLLIKLECSWIFYLT